MIAAMRVLGLYVVDDRLDGGPAFEFAFDGGRHLPLLA
jgi:hypothetical protein